MILLVVWLVGGGAVIWLTAAPVVEAESFGERLSQTLYVLALSLGGSDQLTSVHGFVAAEAGEGRQLPMDFARWLGLILPVWVALPPLVSWLFRSSQRLACRAMLSEHYVVIGYGHVGVSLVKDLLAGDGRSRAVVVIERGGASADLDALQRQGAVVLSEDGSHEEVFKSVATHRAKGILVATGSSVRNIDITGRVARHVKEMRKGLTMGPKVLAVPRIVPHIPERSMMDWATSDEGIRWLQGGNTPQEEDAIYRPSVWPFSAEQTAVRRLLATGSIATYASLKGAARPHLVVLGFDTIAEWLIESALLASLRRDLNGARITVIVHDDGRDAAVSDHKAQLFHRYPFLAAQEGPMGRLREYLNTEVSVHGYDFRELDASLFDRAHKVSKSVQDLSEILTGARPVNGSSAGEWDLSDQGDPVTSVFVCFGEDQKNLDVALRLQRYVNRYRRWQVPTFIRLSQDAGLDDILRRCENQVQLAEVIDDFGQFDAVCTEEEIFNPSRDHAAQAAHEMYQLNEAVAGIGQELKRAENRSIICRLRTFAPNLRPPRLKAQREGLEVLERAVEGPLTALREDRHLVDLSGDAREDAHEFAALRHVLSGQALHPLHPVSRLESAELGERFQAWLATLEAPRDKLQEGPGAGFTAHQLIDALRDRLSRGPTDQQENATPPVHQHWSTLNFQYVASNRQQVDHLPIKLEGLGYRPCAPDPRESITATTLRGPWPVRSTGEGLAWRFAIAYAGDAKNGKGPFRFATGIIENAEVEHKRWALERGMAGWEYAPLRDNTRRHHPLLRTYKDLDKDAHEQFKDLMVTLNHWEVLQFSRPAAKWRPECRIGVIAAGGAAEATLRDDPAVAHAVEEHIVSTILELDLAERAHALRPEPSEGATENADRSAGIQGALGSKPLAVCLVATGRPDTAETTVAQSVVDAVCPKPPGNAANRTNLNRFRALIYKGVRKATERPRIAELLDATGDDVPLGHDWWEIDLLPEGMPTAAFDRAAVPKWGATRNGRAATGDDQENRNEIEKLRGEMEKTTLRQREIDCIRQQSDWVILVDTGETPAPIDAFAPASRSTCDGNALDAENESATVSAALKRSDAWAERERGEWILQVNEIQQSEFAITLNVPQGLVRIAVQCRDATQ